MTESLAHALRDAQNDEGVRVVVLTGTGRGFCSGQDLSGRSLAEGRGLPEGQEAAIADRRYNIQAIQSVARAAQLLDKPYLGAVNGPAAGAGMDLASMTDIRFAGREAKFTTAFARNGIVSGDGGCYFLPRIVGMAKALELLWTSRLFDAEEALSIGYVSRVVDTLTLLDETMAFAEELAANAPIAVQYIKQLAYQSWTQDLETSLRMAQYMQTIATSTEDALEGPRAFREKRRPEFRGR
jgi:2-(1,2-epoxy-1,2-dihydrophenyl)acetyl-CoA isomerase